MPEGSPPPKELTAPHPSNFHHLSGGLIKRIARVTPRIPDKFDLFVIKPSQSIAAYCAILRAWKIIFNVTTCAVYGHKRTTSTTESTSDKPAGAGHDVRRAGVSAHLRARP